MEIFVKSCYWQWRLKKDAVYKTAISTLRGKFFLDTKLFFRIIAPVPRAISLNTLAASSKLSSFNSQTGCTATELSAHKSERPQKSFCFVSFRFCAQIFCVKKNDLPFPRKEGCA
jgi:hypothetical protein